MDSAPAGTIRLALCLSAALWSTPGLARMPPAVVPEARQAAAPAVAPRYHAIVQQAGRKHRISTRLIHAIIAVESAYRADAVSHRGALGLMQLMPATARRYGFTDLLDPAQNIHAGVRHLRELLELFDGNALLALAAYNAGAGAVMHYGGIPPYRETMQYVSKVLDRYAQGYGALPSRQISSSPSRWHSCLPLRCASEVTEPATSPGSSTKIERQRR